MTWLQENWIVAVIILLVVVMLVWWLMARRRSDAIAPLAVEPAAPAKPLAPAKPDIIAAEPARFKAAEPAPAPTPAPPPTEPARAAAAPASPPAAGAADNLQLLKGVGPKLATLLAGLGVTRFDQIAAWTDADIAAIDPELGAFQGRIGRDNWVDQAGYLARGDRTGFETRYGALGGEI